LATIYKEIPVHAPPDFVWDVLRDFGAVHLRLAKGFVRDAVLVGETRTVTYFNGFIAQERIVTVSDELRRLVYSSVGGRTTHHNSALQVFDDPNGMSLVLWVTDFLPEGERGAIEQLVESGAQAIRQTLESAYRQSR
jgi:hypothetical protein